MTKEQNGKKKLSFVFYTVSVRMTLLAQMRTCKETKWGKRFDHLVSDGADLRDTRQLRYMEVR